MDSKVQQAPSRMCERKLIPRPITVKLQSYKDETLKAVRKRQVTFKRAIIGLTADFSAVTVKARDSLAT